MAVQSPVVCDNLDKESVKLVNSGDDDGRLLAGLQKPEVERVNREHP